MTDSDFNYIKPVENLHSVQSLTPARQNEERKRRQKPPGQQEQPGDQPTNETPQEPTPDQNTDLHKIDYCA